MHADVVESLAKVVCSSVAGDEILCFEAPLDMRAGELLSMATAAAGGDRFNFVLPDGQQLTVDCDRVGNLFASSA